MKRFFGGRYYVSHNFFDMKCSYYKEEYYLEEQAARCKAIALLSLAQV